MIPIAVIPAEAGIQSLDPGLRRGDDCNDSAVSATTALAVASPPGLSVTARPHVFSDLGAATHELPAGLTIADMLDAVGWAPALRDCTRVYVGGVDVPPDLWARARPKPGTEILVAMVPMGGRGSGKQIFAAIASIAIMVVAPYAAAGILGYGATAAGVTAAAAQSGFAFAAVSAGLSIAGSLAVSALFKPSKVSTSPATFTPATSPAYSITGQSNAKTPYQPCLKVYGRHRLFPRVVGDPYYTVEGPDTFLTMVLDWGYAPLLIEDVRIGETPLASFSDCQIIHHLQFKAGDPLFLYTDDVYTLPLSYTLQYQQSVVARTRPDAKVATLDFFFPGLIAWHKDYSVPLTIQSWLGVEWRDVTANGPWRALEGVGVTIHAPKGAGADSTAGIAFTVAATTIAADVGTGQPTTYGLMAGTAAIEVTGARIPSVGDVFVLDGAARTVSAVSGRTVSFAPPLSAALATEEARRYAAKRWDGSQEWIAYPPHDIALTTAPKGSRIVIENNELKAFSVSARIEFPAASEYEFRVTRLSQHKIPPNFDPASVGRDAFEPDSVVDDVMWVGVKSYAIGRAPLAPKVPRTISEVRLRSSDQFNGVVNTISGIANAFLPVRDGTTGIYALGLTRNPAWAVRDVLCGAWNPRAVPASQIDDAAFALLAVHCDTWGFRCDTVIDYAIRAQDLIDSMLASCRAAMVRKGNKYSVVIDGQAQPLAQTFSRENSEGFSGARAFAELPHAWRVKWIDPDSGWQERTRIVPRDWADDATRSPRRGYYDPEQPPADITGMLPATLFEDLPAFGVTGADHAWILGRLTHGEAELRPTEYYLQADMSHMVCNVGSRVGVQSYALGSGGVTCHVADVIDANRLRVTEPFGSIDPAGQYAVVIRYASGAISNAIRCYPVAGADDVWRTAATHGAAVDDVVVWGFADRVLTDFIVKRIEPGPNYTARLVLMDHGDAIPAAASGPIPKYFPPTGGRPEDGFGLTPRNVTPALIERITAERVRVYDIRLAWEDNPLAFEWRVYRVNPRTEARTPLLQPTAPACLAIEGLDRRFLAAAGEDVVLEVTGVSRLGTESRPARVSVRVVPDTAAPLPPRTFATSINERQVTLLWSPPEEDDVVAHQIRFSTSLTAADWDSAEIIALAIPWDITSETFPARIGTYMIKSRDSAGNFSAYAQTAQVKEIPAGAGNVLLSVDVGDGRNFSGTTYDCSVVSGALQADGADTFWLRDSLPFWGADDALFWRPTVYKDMQWVFSVDVPAAGIGTDMRIASTITGNGTRIEYSRDATSWVTWPGKVIAESGTYHFRVSVTGGAVQGVISDCFVTFDVPDVEQMVGATDIAAAGTRLTLTKAFRAITAVIPGLDKSTAHNAISIGVVDMNPTLGPLVKGIDAAGAYVSGRATFLIRGY